MENDLTLMRQLLALGEAIDNMKTADDSNSSPESSSEAEDDFIEESRHIYFLRSDVVT